MTSRKLDLICNAINEQNALDEEQILKETKINSRLVNIWNNNRESLHKKNDFRERRFQDGRVRNELMKLENVSTTKEQRGNTADTKMNTYPHQNFLLDPKNKKNIYNYIDNLNFILDKNNEYRDNYHKNMLKRMNFFNFNKKRYFTNIYDKFYNVNNDKKWMSNDIIFFLNRAVKDEIKEDIDFKHANKHNKYQTFLKNRNDDILDFNQNFNTRLIEAKTRYNDFYLDKDDILLKRVNDVRDGKYDFFDDPDRDYYHKTGINKDELKKRHKLEENKKKKRQETIKSLEEQRRKRMQNILEKEKEKIKEKEREQKLKEIKPKIDTNNIAFNRYKDIKIKANDNKNININNITNNINTTKKSELDKNKNKSKNEDLTTPITPRKKYQDNAIKDIKKLPNKTEKKKLEKITEEEKKESKSKINIDNEKKEKKVEKPKMSIYKNIKIDKDKSKKEKLNEEISPDNSINNGYPFNEDKDKSQNNINDSNIIIPTTDNLSMMGIINTISNKKDKNSTDNSKIQEMKNMEEEFEEAEDEDDEIFKQKLKKINTFHSEKNYQKMKLELSEFEEDKESIKESKRRN